MSRSTEGLTLVQKIPLQSYPPRLYLNGFPKSGLHLLEQMVSPFLTPGTCGRGGGEWLGCFKWHSFSNEMLDVRNTAWRLSLLERGRYLKGHLGHLDVFESVMFWGNIGQIMVVRDLRDVAVSTAHHIWSENDVLKHEHKDLYRMLGSFDEVLLAVIEGLRPYPGLMERWEKYTRWLDLDWVMKVDFADLIGRPEEMARSILKYALYNATHLLENRIGHVEFEPETEARLVQMMVESAARKDQSTTFREGKTGGWREAFSERHKAAFKAADTGGWLARLGYAEDDW